MELRILRRASGDGLRGAGASVRFRVAIDVRPSGAAHGIDIDEQGLGVVTEHRLYQPIRQTGPVADRQFEIEFIDAGVDALAFTFGLSSLLPIHKAVN